MGLCVFGLGFTRLKHFAVWRSRIGRLEFAVGWHVVGRRRLALLSKRVPLKVSVVNESPCFIEAPETITKWSIPPPHTSTETWRCIACWLEDQEMQWGV